MKDLRKLYIRPLEIIGLRILFIVAEAHYRFDNSPIVPATVKKDNLTGIWQFLDVASKIPLSLLLLGRFTQRNDTGASGVQVFHKSFYGSPFTSCNTGLKRRGNGLF